MIKRFWVLAWYDYYPSSGLGNVHSTWETMEEADREVQRLKDNATLGDHYDNIRVYDVSDLLGVNDYDESI
jgi:hypothetical protein